MLILSTPLEVGNQLEPTGSLCDRPNAKTGTGGGEGRAVLGKPTLRSGRHTTGAQHCHI